MIGGAVGAAIVGMRPICEMQFADFVACGFDQLVNVAGKLHYRLGLAAPIVVRLPSGGGFSGGPYHSQNPEAWFMHAPGLKVLAPATARGREGPAARRDRRPQPRRLPRAQVPLPPDPRRGARRRLHDADVRTHGARGRRSRRDRLRRDGPRRDRGGRSDRRGASIRVLDLRSLVPLDEQAILDAVRECAKVVVVDEANYTCAAGAQIASLIARARLRRPRRPGRARRDARCADPVRAGARERRAAERRADPRRLPRPARLLSALGEPRGRVQADSEAGPDARRAVVEIVMPQLGVSVVEGTIIAWRKHPGDQVEADEAVCDVATDKIDSELPAPCRGRIAELLVEEGETVDVGTVIATMHADAAAAPPPATAPPAERAPAPAAPAPRSRSARAPLAGRVAARRRARRRRRAARPARASAGVSARRTCSRPPRRGPRPPASAATSRRRRASCSRMRLLIGEHMKRSLATAATVTSWIEVDFERDRGAPARARHHGASDRRPRRPSRRSSSTATSTRGSTARTTSATREVNLGIAVSLGDDGLIVPVLQGRPA